MEKEKILEIVDKSVSLMKRMGENIDSSNFVLYENNFRVPFLIEEGLIKSYPADSVMSFISKAFNFKYMDEKNLEDLFGKGHEYHGRIYKENDTQNSCERIIIETGGDFNDQEKLDFYMEKYGWFLARIDDNVLTYEKKFDEYATVFQLLAHGVGFLYHVSSYENAENIMRKGLKSKSRTNKNGYMHGERVYLFLNEPTKEDLIVSFPSKDYAVFTVDLNGVSETNRLYFDPRVRNALYTYEPIPPKAIIKLGNDIPVG